MPLQLRYVTKDNDSTWCNIGMQMEAFKKVISSMHTNDFQLSICLAIVPINIA